MSRITNGDIEQQVVLFNRRKAYAFPLLSDGNIDRAFGGYKLVDTKSQDLLGTGYTTKRKLYDALCAVNFVMGQATDAQSLERHEVAKLPH